MNERRIRFEPRTEFRRDERSPFRKGDYRREAPIGEMNIAEMIGFIIGLMTTTKMISEGNVISLTKPKITGGKMDTPTEEAQRTYQPLQV